MKISQPEAIQGIVHNDFPSTHLFFHRQHFCTIKVKVITKQLRRITASVTNAPFSITCLHWKRSSVNRKCKNKHKQCTNNTKKNSFCRNAERTGALRCCDAEKCRAQNAEEKRTESQHWPVLKRDAERKKNSPLETKNVNQNVVPCVLQVLVLFQTPRK